MSALLHDPTYLVTMLGIGLAVAILLWTLRR